MGWYGGGIALPPCGHPRLARAVSRVIGGDCNDQEGEHGPPHWLPALALVGYSLIAPWNHGPLRWGELTGLTVRHVDPLHQRIAVVQQLVDTRGSLTFAEPKTKAGRRIVEVPPFVVKQLTTQIAGKGPDDLVFTTEQNSPLRQANFRKRVWLPALRRIGLAGLRFHDLRHTHVALSIAAGAEMLALTRRLGHTRTSFTLDRYGHLLPGADKAIADGLERVHQVAATDEQPTVGIRRLS